MGSSHWGRDLFLTTSNEYLSPHFIASKRFFPIKQVIDSCTGCSNVSAVNPQACPSSKPTITAIANFLSLFIDRLKTIQAQSMKPIYVTNTHLNKNTEMAFGRRPEFLQTNREER